MVPKIFSPVWKPHFAQIVLYLLTISIPVEAGAMRYRVDSRVHPQTNEDW